MANEHNGNPWKLGRRRFLAGLAGAATGALLPLPAAALRQAAGALEAARTGTPPTLQGNVFELTVAPHRVDFGAGPRVAVCVNGCLPAPTLRFREGEEVTLRVTNRLPVATSIHWHGILVPADMDGVPGLSFPGIAPGETFVYRFRLRQAGTYWYHAHTAFQELSGLYGALVVEPRGGEAERVDRDLVVVLSDWTDDDPAYAFKRLRVESHVYNYNRPTLPEFFADVRRLGLAGAVERRLMWSRMRMSPVDLADTSAALLRFLVNGTPPEGNWTAQIHPGERVRLRFVNAASNTFYDVRIPGLPLRVIQVDGQDVEPVTVDEFRFGPGETLDAVVEPREEAHTLFAQAMDRSGYARATLATRPGLVPPVPSLDPVQWLTMEDMMGAAGQGGTHGHHANRAHGTGHTAMHSGSHIAMHSGDPNAGHRRAHADRHGPASPAVRHARTEFGPAVDMRVDVPKTRLDDPGVGLRDLVARGLRPPGHRVLTLADLRSRPGVVDDPREPVAEWEFHLTGNMERFSWSFDGLEFGASTPVSLRLGERVRIVLHNDTMMTHPMHLHGMWSDLEDPAGGVRLRRHTVPVQPAQRISFLTTPVEVGRWAWHCHLLFHMEAGMFREVLAW